MIRDKADTAEPDGGDSERPSKPRRRFLKGGLVAAPAVFTMRQSYAAIGSAAACVARNVQDFRETRPAVLAGTAVDSWVRVPWIYFEFVPANPFAAPHFLAPTAEVRSQIVDVPVDGDYYLTDAQGVAFSPLKTVRLTRPVIVPPVENASPPTTNAACAAANSTSTGSLTSGYELPTRFGRPERPARGFDSGSTDRSFDPKRFGERSRDRRDRSGQGAVMMPPEASATTNPCASGGSVATTTTTTGTTFDGRSRRYRGIDGPQDGAADRIRNPGGGSAALDAGSSWTSAPSRSGATGFATAPGPIVGKARRTDPMEDPGAARQASARDRDTDRASRNGGWPDRGVTTPLTVESPSAPVTEATVLPPASPSGPVGEFVYAIDDSPGLWFRLGAQNETNIVRLYDGVTGAPMEPLAVGENATYVALTASCDASINPNTVG